MMRKFLLVAALSLIAIAATAESSGKGIIHYGSALSGDRFSFCKLTADLSMKRVPERIDERTARLGVKCEQGSPRPTLLSIMLLDVKQSNINPSAFEEMRKKKLANSCKNRDAIELLNAMNISYEYLDTKGNDLGAFTLKIEDCWR